MPYDVTIDQDECMSTGKCINAAPTGFAFDDDELAVVLPGASDLDDTTLEKIAAACPGQAITLTPR